MRLPIGLYLIWLGCCAVEYVGDTYGGAVLGWTFLAIFGTLWLFSPKYTGEGPCSVVT